MSSILKSFLMVLGLFLVNGCKEDKTPSRDCKAPIVINMDVVVSNAPLELQTQLYTDYKERNFKVELFKFYLSNWALEKQDGSMTALNQINLVDFSSSNDLNIEAEIDTGCYKNIHFGIGLDSITNASDPAVFESTNPLSIAQNTYWNWASKYKFFMLEGRVDSSGGTNPNLAFSYHTGFNDLYREVTLSLNDLMVNTNGDSLRLELDIAKVVDGSYGTVDFVSESFSHATDETGITETISNNLQNSFSIK